MGTELALKAGGRIDLLELSRKLAAEVEAHAMALGVPVCISVVDAHGNPVLFHRMTGSLLIAIGMASLKAQTAVAMRVSTAELTALVEPGQPLFSLTSAGGGRYVAFGGGLPIIVGQEMVAACLMTFRAEKARRNRWERVAALSSAARVGSGVC